ncbi:endonuclease domain-containing protein [Pectinatus frisingensis]|jgi:very-short-patch-repair endonuclease|uniref:endonuclease domain-containing protein n=1 Tax=Pectinatus frisingensis TaxID=865 RepID=UPI0018C545C3|nr:endonuclease domain-containing protein [Pectinatus frisingensis]
MSLPYNRKNKSISKFLRKTMTKEERHLWYDFLRNYPIKFYRQRRIENYIVDFYCNYAKLVIEVDGGQHYSETGHINDNKRTLLLQKYGLYVMRFSNTDVIKHFTEVCYTIDAYIKHSHNKNS